MNLVLVLEYFLSLLQLNRISLRFGAREMIGQTLSDYTAIVKCHSGFLVLMEMNTMIMCNFTRNLILQEMVARSCMEPGFFKQKGTLFSGTNSSDSKFC